MAVFYMSTASVTVNTVDLSSYVKSVVFTHEKDQLEVSAMSDTGHRYTGGPEMNNLAVEFYDDLAAAKVFETLWSAVGSGTNTVVFKPVSATGPTLTLSNAYLPSAPTGGNWGEVATTSVTFTGGTVVKS